MSSKLRIRVGTLARAASVALILAYAAMLAWIYALNAYVPDEIRFMNRMVATAQPLMTRGVAGLVDFWLTTKNYDGYGSLYWQTSAGVAGIGYVTGIGATVALRTFSLLLMLVTPALLIVATWRRDPLLGMILLALWFSCPLAWWVGKLISPEPLLFALGGTTVFAGLREGVASRRLAFCLSGVLAGLKLSAAPVAFFVGLVWLFRTRRQAQLAVVIEAGLLGLLGFLLANPILLADADSFLAALLQVLGNGAKNSPAGFGTVLISERETWDLIATPGIFGALFSAPATALVATGLALSRPPASLVAALALALGGAVAMFVRAPVFYAWYIFPVAALLLVFLAQEARSTAAVRVCLALAVSVNAVILGSAVVRELESKVLHASNLAEAPAVASCLTSANLGLKSVDRILDLSEVGYGVSQNQVHFPIDWPTVAPRLRNWRGEIEIVDRYRAYQAIEMVLAGEEPREGVLLLVGDRFKSSALLGRFAGARDEGEPGWRIIGRCRHVNVWTIASEASVAAGDT